MRLVSCNIYEASACTKLSTWLLISSVMAFTYVSVKSVYFSSVDWMKHKVFIMYTEPSVWVNLYEKNKTKQKKKGYIFTCMVCMNVCMFVYLLARMYVWMYVWMFVSLFFVFVFIFEAKIET